MAKSKKKTKKPQKRADFCLRYNISKATLARWFIKKGIDKLIPDFKKRKIFTPKESDLIMDSFDNIN